MDIKPTQPGQLNWNRTSESAPAEQAAKPTDDSPLGAAAGSPRFDAIRADFKRADLSGPRWNSLLERSIAALLDSTSDKMGGLPGGAREKLSSLLAADPIFSRR